MVSCNLGRKVQIKYRNNIELKQVKELCYRGTVIEEKEGCSKAVGARAGKAWQNWSEVIGVCAIKG